MATYYLDYEGGNDGNDGTTFANRWKTFNNGATAARIAPNDTIRVMGTPPPDSLGVNATFTNDSNTIVLASALTKLVTDCDSNWTASTNVTCTLGTSPRASGTNVVSVAVAAGFTTGKIAYFGLGASTDFSSYQGLTFWMTTNATISASNISLRLCSDTTGTTAVDTLYIPAQTASSLLMIGVYIDKGSALGAAIQSIALYADSDPGTVTMTFDNINATGAAGATCLHLNTLIGKNVTGDGWYGIRAISGTTVTIDTANVKGFTPANSAKGYYGTTETVAAYKLTPVTIASTNDLTIQDSGTAGSLITFSGGWNRTDMSTQTLETWYAPARENTFNGITVSSRSFVRVDNIHLWRFNQAYNAVNAENCEIGSMQLVHCTTMLNLNNCARLTIDTLLAIGCQSSRTAAACRGARITNLTCRNHGYTGTDSCWQTSTTVHNDDDWRIDTLTVRGCAGYAVEVAYGTVCRRLYIKTLDAKYCTPTSYAAVNLDRGLDDYRIDSLSATDGTVGVYFGGGYGSVGTLTTSGNSTGGVRVGTEASGFLTGIHRVNNTSLTDTTPVVANVWSPGDGWVHFGKWGGSSTDHRSYYDGSGAFMAAEAGINRHTASGLGWRIDCLNANYDSDFPVMFRLAELVLEKDVASTLKLFVKRSSTTIQARLRVLGWEVPGIPDDVSTTAVQTPGTWEELSLSVTPTAHGVLTVLLDVWGGATSSVYFDDFTVS